MSCCRYFSLFWKAWRGGVYTSIGCSSLALWRHSFVMTDAQTDIAVNLVVTQPGCRIFASYTGIEPGIRFLRKTSLRTLCCVPQVTQDTTPLGLCSMFKARFPHSSREGRVAVYYHTEKWRRRKRLSRREPPENVSFDSCVLFVVDKLSWENRSRVCDVSCHV